MLKSKLKLLTRVLPDKWYIYLQYYRYFGRLPNLKNPKTFNEKLQWLKLHDRKPIYTTMVDKYEAKKYIAERIGEEYVIPTYGVWDSFDEIDFDSLPNQFVLKTTHDCGGLVICKDKATLDKKAAKAKLSAHLKRNYFWQDREWPYKTVKPRILAEEFMVDDSGTELRDYKVMCFGGEPKLIQYHCGRFENHTQDFYSTEWHKLEFTQGCPAGETVLEKPTFLDKMLELSRMLSANIPHVRVDWYYANGQLYFGELTLFDDAGLGTFDPPQWDVTLGNWIDLPPSKLLKNRQHKTR